MSDEQRNTQTSNTGSSKAPSKKDAIHSAFLLGWLIMELRSRFEVQLKAPSSSGGLHLASQWRALFTRVADLQSKTFPNAITAKTLYDPPRVFARTTLSAAYFLTTNWSLSHTMPAILLPVSHGVFLPEQPIWNR